MKRIRTSTKARDNRLIKLLKRIVLVLFILFLCVVIAGVGAFEYLKIQGKNASQGIAVGDTYSEIIEYDGKKYKYNENMVTVAFLGIDKTELTDLGESDFAGASDAMMVVAIDTRSKKARVIALPREIMTEMNTYYDGTDEVRQQEIHQLYLAYSYGGGGELSCQNAVETISRVLYGVSIPYYYALDLDGIAALNDAIGGVVIKPKCDIPAYDIVKDKVTTLKGEASQSYVRTRDTENAEGSLERLDRQVQYVESFVMQVAPAIMTDITKLYRLYDVGSQYSRTNLTASDAAYLASLLMSGGSVTFDTYTIDGEMTTYEDETLENTSHAAFYPDEDSLMKTVLDVFYTRIG